MADTERAEQTPGPAGLSVVSTAIEGVRVLTLAGGIDHHTGDQLRQALDFSDADRPRFVVDLRQVTFIDSSGSSILIAAHQAITAAGGWLRLAGAQQAVLRTLQIVGADDVIDCRSTLREKISL